MMEIRNPRFDSDGKRINCEIKHPLFGWIETTLSEDDPNDSGRKLFREVISGEHGPIAPAPPPPEPTDDELKAEAREMIAREYRRNKPKTDDEKIAALEIIVGVEDPDPSLIESLRASYRKKQER